MKTPVETAEAYYIALSQKDSSAMAQYLHPNVHFLTPLVDVKGKEAVLEAAARFFLLFKSLKMRAKFGNDDQAMVVYDLECPMPIGLFHSCAFMAFEDNLITQIQLFYDARPFG